MGIVRVNHRRCSCPLPLNARINPITRLLTLLFEMAVRLHVTHLPAVETGARLTFKTAITTNMALLTAQVAAGVAPAISGTRPARTPAGARITVVSRRLQGSVA